MSSSLASLKKIVSALLTRPDSGPFREPVDWRLLGLDDYPSIVLNPIDLGTIKRRLESNYYKNDEGGKKKAWGDVRRVWDNCMLYNSDGSDFHALAASFRRRGEDMWVKAGGESRGGDNDSDEESDRCVDLEMKQKLSADIFRISGDDLGHVVALIESKCPQALSNVRSMSSGGEGSAGDGEPEMEINLDLVPSEVFFECRRYVRLKVLERVGKRADARLASSSNSVMTSGKSKQKRKRFD